MLQSNAMKPAGDAASGGRLVLLLIAGEEVDPDGPTDPTIEERALGTRVEVCVHIDGLAGFSGFVRRKVRRGNRSPLRS